MTAVNPVATPEWATYIDFKEMVEYLQEPEPSEGSVRAKLLQRFIDSGCTFVQNRLGRPVCPTRFTERHDGWSGDTILLRHCPFVKLVLCREYQSSGGFVTLAESTPENPVEGVQIDYATSQLTRTFQGYSWPRPFFPGARNVEVTYLAGFNPVPPDLWEATMELIAWKWRNTQQASRSFSPKTSDFDESSASDGLWPGTPNRVAEVLSAYWIPSV